MKRHSINANGTAPAVQAWRLMVEFFQAQRHHFERTSAEFELTKQQSHVLHVLANEGPHSSRQLAEILGCDASNVTGLIDRLAARSLVTRTQAPDDRRKRMLAITRHGARLQRRVTARLAQAPPAIAVLEPGEQCALRDLLARALRNARSEKCPAGYRSTVSSVPAAGRVETSRRTQQYAYHSNSHRTHRVRTVSQ